MVDALTISERKEYLDRDNLLSVVEHAAKGSGMAVKVDGKTVKVGVGEETDPLLEAVSANPKGTLTPLHVLNGTMSIEEAQKARAEAEPFFPIIVPFYGDEVAITLLGQGIAMGIKPGQLDKDGTIKDVRIVFKKGDKLVDPPSIYTPRAKYQKLFGPSKKEGNTLVSPIIKSTA